MYQGDDLGGGSFNGGGEYFCVELARDVCPDTGLARLSYGQARALLDEHTSFRGPGTGWDLHEYRHSSLTHLGEQGSSLLMLACELRLGGARVTALERLTEVDSPIKGGTITTPSAEALYRRGVLPAPAEAMDRFQASQADHVGGSSGAPVSPAASAAAFSGRAASSVKASRSGPGAGRLVSRAGQCSRVTGSASSPAAECHVNSTLPPVVGHRRLWRGWRCR
ncbi:recombinase [Streptomyces hygroscopicus]|nr:recombinase [Streptomyces hygroscopicus]